jgi:uncharacterized linocin/CFP29 family protein
MSVSEKFTKMGKESQNMFIKSNHGNANVYFKLPIQLVKVEHVEANDGLARINRLLEQAINGAYAYVGQKMVFLGEKKASNDEVKAAQEQVYTVETEGDMVVIMNGLSQLSQIGYKKEVEDIVFLKAYFEDVLKACNGGFIRAQQESAKLMQKHLS